MKPSWKGRGETSVLWVLGVVERVLEDGEAAVVIVDDNKARLAIRVGTEFDIDLMGTESFIKWIHRRFKVAGAEHAWAAIRIAAGGKEPIASRDDPVFLRR
ncbi:MAG: hypothetical protein FWD68_20410 [Alphaproteobacteria bacterium]|nr:hypothetical protein [Alphaproteobacteria bacterium]